MRNNIERRKAVVTRKDNEITFIDLYVGDKRWVEDQVKSFIDAMNYETELIDVLDPNKHPADNQYLSDHAHIVIEHQNYFKGARWTEVRYTNKGAYFTHKSHRYYLQDFMKSDNNEFDASLPLNNFGGMVIKLDDKGEAVKVGYSF